MKRMRSIFVLGILSLFIGVTTVTSYAQNNPTSVEAGIRFTNEGDVSTDESQNVGDDQNTSSTESGGKENTDQTDKKENNSQTLPKTGEKSSSILTMSGIILVLIIICLIYRSSKKEKSI